MNFFRLTVKDGVTDALIIHSSIDRQHRITNRTDERVGIGRDDVCVLKNYADTPADLVLTGMEMQHGRTVFRPSRQCSFTLYEGRDAKLTLGPGESVVMRCEFAQDPKSAAAGAVPA